MAKGCEAMIIRIAICDDETAFLNDLYKHITASLSKQDSNFTVDTFNSGDMLCEAFDSNGYDIVFLDIDMPKMNGLEAARKIKNTDDNNLLIFVTSHNEYVYESFKVSPFRFIRKNRYDELDEAIDSAINEVKSLKFQSTFKTDTGAVCVSISDIFAFTSINHQVYLCTKREKIRIYSSLRELESKYEDFGFVRTHTSYLVNIRYIYRINDNVVLLVDNSELPVSRRRMKTVKEKFIKFSE